MEQNEFLSVMRDHTDEKLIEIVNQKRRDYQPRAVEAAEFVLNERQVSYDKLSDNDLANIDEAKITVAEACYIRSDWKRFFEYIIDYIIIGIIACPFADFIGIWGELAIIFVYYFVMESFFGKTVGKLCFGLKVVNIEGNKPDTRMIIIRSLCRFIPFEGLSFIMGGWSNHELKSNWHDRFSETYVVESDLLEEYKTKLK